MKIIQKKIQCTVLFCTLFAVSSAQDSKPELFIGDRLPVLQFENVLNYYSSVARISDFKGKALILDFWAPWCTPCIAMFPKLDSFQNKYSEDLQVLSITRENKKFVEKSLANFKKVKGTNLVSITEDTVLNQLFKHTMMPHYVWIDSNRIVRGITGSEALTEINIRNLIEGRELDLPVKADSLIVFPENEVPFLSRGPNKSETIYHSVLTKYKQNVVKTSGWGDNYILCTNHTIKLLYKIAFGKFNLDFLSDRILILENFKTAEDSLNVGVVTPEMKDMWTAKGYDLTYCYELYLPDSIGFDRLMLQMQQDLNRLFALKGIQGRRERRQMKVLELVRTSDIDKIGSKGGPVVNEYSRYYINMKNVPIFILIDRIQVFESSQGILPFINKTGYKANVDLELNADIANIPALNKELAKYDLKLVEATAELEVIVLTKTVIN